MGMPACWCVVPGPVFSQVSRVMSQGSCGFRGSSTAFLLLIGQGPGADKLEGGFLNGAGQHQHSCHRIGSQIWLLTVSLSPR